MDLPLPQTIKNAIRFNRPLGKAIRLPLKIVSPRLITTIKSGRLKGLKWIVGSATHGCWLGTYERTKLNSFAAHVKPGNVVYDVGANVGFYTLAATRFGATVVAFEPLPRNLYFLRQHLALNGVTDVQVIDAAVSSADERARFSNNVHASMGALSDHGDLEVKTVTLDRLVTTGEIPPPGVIKMDIEGGEAKALLGAETVIARHRPTVFVATHGSDVHADCVRFLQRFKYQIQAIGSSDELLALP